MERQRSSHEYHYSVPGIANAAVQRIGLSSNDLSDGSRLDLFDGFARALIEQQRLYQLRYRDRLQHFQPVDPIFTSTCRPTTAEGEDQHCNVSPVIEPTALGPTLGEAIEAYIAAKPQTWTTKTLTAQRLRFGYLSQHLGAEKRLTTITPDHVRR